MKVLARGMALVPEAVQGTESLFSNQTGEQKKAAAVEIVGAAIDVVNAVSAKHIADADGFTAGLGQIIDGVVACLNASVWAK